MTVQRFPIEAGQVLVFRRALGHEDAERGADTSSDALVPATFVQASAHFDSDYILRPRPGDAAPDSRGRSASPGLAPMFCCFSI